MAMETEYSEYDPELAESFRSLRDFERNYGDKLDLLMNFNQPIDPTAHEQAYQYQSYNLTRPSRWKTNATPRRRRSWGRRHAGDEARRRWCSRCTRS